jgi:hypothetical protein
VSFVSCPCGKQSTVKQNGFVSEIRKASGFEPILSNVKSMIWLCPECYHKTHELALAIHAIIKDEHVDFPSLLEAREPLIKC